MGGCCSGVDIDISLRDVNVSNVSNRTRSGATKPPRGRGFSLSLWRARGPRPSRYEQQFGLDDQDDARWVTTAGTDPNDAAVGSRLGAPHAGLATDRGVLAVPRVTADLVAGPQARLPARARRPSHRLLPQPDGFEGVSPPLYLGEFGTVEPAGG